jgi:hypothetical protein
LQNAKRAAVVTQEIRCGRLGITACRNTATNEEVKIAIAVQVGQSEWTGGRELADERRLVRRRGSGS